jgi:Arc/MetJ-type ribon-helix-helix transcriptional regulator
MTKLKTKNKLISVRIPDYVDNFITELGTLFIGKKSNKSDFINEAISVYCWSILKKLESENLHDKIKFIEIDQETRIQKEITFNEYLKMFE